MVDVIKLISGMPLFAGLSKAQYEALARIWRAAFLPEGGEALL